MKRLIFPLVIIIALSAMITSCNDRLNNGKGGGYYGSYLVPNAIVTTKTSDAGVFYMQLDDSTTIVPSNISSSPYNRNMRALINFTDDGAWSGTGTEEYDRFVTINVIDTIRTKDAVETSGDEDTDNDTYGTAYIDIIDNTFCTVFEDDYLTLVFRASWGNPYLYHEINLVTGTDSNNTYLVELRHNPLEDVNYASGRRYLGVMAFDLSNINELVDAEYLDVKYTSLSGTETTISIERNTDYYSASSGLTRSSSSEDEDVSLSLPVK